MGFKGIGYKSVQNGFRNNDGSSSVIMWNFLRFDNQLCVKYVKSIMDHKLSIH